MNWWIVIVNGCSYRVKATNPWTATTRGIKSYLRTHKLRSMNNAEIRLIKEK